MVMLKAFSIKAKLYSVALIALVGMGVMMLSQYYANNTIQQLNESRLKLEEIKSGMLMLRRNEKDFIARSDLKYQKKFNENFKQLITSVNQLGSSLDDVGIDSKKVKSVKSDFNDYHKMFTRYVQIQQKIGLNHKAGLYGYLREAVHKVENKIKLFHETELLADILMLRRREKDFMLRLDLKYLDKFSKDYVTFNNHLDNSNISSDDKLKVQKLMQDYKTHFFSFVDGIKERGLTSKSGLLGEMRNTVHKTESLSMEMHKSLEDIVNAKESSLLWILFITSVVVSLFVVATIFFVAQSILQPIKDLANLMENVSSSKNLTLRYKAESNDEISTIGEAFNHIQEVFDSSIGQVLHSTSTLNGGVHDLTKITAAMRDETQHQEKETAHLVSAMNEMLAATQGVANSATYASEASQKADQEAIKGRELVNQTIDNINKLASEVENSSDEIDELKQETENISTVLEVISGIAEQTNLLALNAAIEAARAGEQGRGFAVVADEVRTLASRSQDSTQQIREIIERLQARSSTAVHAMKQGRMRALECVDQADVAAKALELITDAVSSINEMNMQIASSAEEQSLVSEEINRSINEINTTISKSAESTNQTTDTGEKLTVLTTELQFVIDQFKTNS